MGYCAREGEPWRGFMRNAITGSLVLAAVVGVAPLKAQTAPSAQAQSRQAEVERQFDAALSGAEMAGWMKIMAARRRKTLVVCGSCHTAIHSGRPPRKPGGDAAAQE